MHIAIEGCSHGELDIIYNSILQLEHNHNIKIDLLLCCGDFQSVRNEQDLKCMAVPVKYMQMQDFHRYYSGEKKAPVLTIIIGGNHEASNYLQELPFGGWLAPNIYYLGYAGMVKVNGLRIGGLSGIYKGNDYLKGHYEQTPYTAQSIRSIYHVRNLEVFRLKQLSGHVDMFMSHDWPRGIYHHGDTSQLLKFKPDFENEINTNTLGSRPAEELLNKIRPKYWFSGHLHVKFVAAINHKGASDGKSKVTRFLALDKCLPRRQFLQVIEMPGTTPHSKIELSHDAEWLTILRLTNHLLSTSERLVYMPGPGGSERYNFTPTESEIKETISKLGGNLSIPLSNFCMTSKCFQVNCTPRNMHNVKMPKPLCNPQTQNLCLKLGLDDPLALLSGWTESGKMNVGRKCSRGLNKSELNVTMNSSRLSINESAVQSDDEIDHSTDIILDFTGQDLDSLAEEDEGRSSPLDSAGNITPPKKSSDILNISPPRVDEIRKRKSLSLSSPRDISNLPFGPSDENKMSTPIRRMEPQFCPLESPISEEDRNDHKFLTPNTKRKVTSWLLPGTESYSNDESTTSCGESGDEKNSSSNFNKDSSSKTDTSSLSGTELIGTPIIENISKKIKRRNVAMYSALEDEC